MEDNEYENGKVWEYLKSIEIVTMVSLSTTVSNISVLSSINHPLLSCIITLYVLVLLYLPQRFSLRIIFSPVLVLTASLLLSLLRLGAIQTETKQKRNLSQAEAEKRSDFSRQELIWETCKKDPDFEMQSFEEKFVEWDVRAPLEVIYEAYEGEGEDPKESDPNLSRVIERYPSPSLYYPESDSDSSSSEMCYRWEDEDREGLIEIALNRRDMDYFHGEEENLIEIDISSIEG